MASIQMCEVSIVIYHSFTVFCHHAMLAVLQMRQGERDFCLGEDMYDAHKAGDVMPQAADINDDDSDVMKEMKAVINEMTTFDPAKRPSAGTVLTMVMASQTRLLRQVRDDQISHWLYPADKRSAVFEPMSQTPLVIRRTSNRVHTPTMR